MMWHFDWLLQKFGCKTSSDYINLSKQLRFCHLVETSVLGHCERRCKSMIRTVLHVFLYVFSEYFFNNHHHDIKIPRQITTEDSNHIAHPLQGCSSIIYGATSVAQSCVIVSCVMSLSQGTNENVHRHTLFHMREIWWPHVTSDLSCSAVSTSSWV